MTPKIFSFRTCDTYHLSLSPDFFMRVTLFSPIRTWQQPCAHALYIYMYISCTNCKFYTDCQWTVSVWGYLYRSFSCHPQSMSSPDLPLHNHQDPVCGATQQREGNKIKIFWMLTMHASRDRLIDKIFSATVLARFPYTLYCKIRRRESCKVIYRQEKPCLEPSLTEQDRESQRKVIVAEDGSDRSLTRPWHAWVWPSFLAWVGWFVPTGTEGSVRGCLPADRWSEEIRTWTTEAARSGQIRGYTDIFRWEIGLAVS